MSFIFGTSDQRRTVHDSGSHVDPELLKTFFKVPEGSGPLQGKQRTSQGSGIWGNGFGSRIMHLMQEQNGRMWFAIKRTVNCGQLYT